jgi:serine/threonine protein kinase
MGDSKSTHILANYNGSCLNVDFLGKIEILKSLARSIFPLYLVYCPRINNFLVLKIFPYKDNQVCSSYRREAGIMRRFHNRFLFIYTMKDKEEIICKKGEKMTISYILMEYAPYGDLWEITFGKDIQLGDVLLRTYFHQLIEGIEYLHARGIAHLDIKLENLIIGSDYTLKIIDFDQSTIRGEISTRAKGTKGYRSPELTVGKCNNPMASDIYSVGIVLFLLKFGFFPYNEDPADREGYKLYELLATQNHSYWDTIDMMYEGSYPHDDEDLLDLFMAMVHWDTRRRATIEEIKRSKWYRGPVYTERQLRAVMKKKLKKAKNFLDQLPECCPINIFRAKEIS